MARSPWWATVPPPAEWFATTVSDAGHLNLSNLDHAVYENETGAGVLIRVRYLTNDVTVVQENVAAVTWHHIELASHDVVLAEGLAAETYLDTGNRHAFDGNGPVLAMRPDFARHRWQGFGYAPLVTAGPRLVAARRRLHAIALASGTRPAVPHQAAA